jgi:hypothetical protein
MNRRLELKLQYWAAWGGVVFLVGYAISFGLLGHNHPPPSPNYTPQELAAHYFIPYKSQIEAGMAICMVVGVFYLPWAAAMSRVMWRREHCMPLLSSISLVGGAVTAWLVAEFPGKILHAAELGASQPVLAHSIWREAWIIYDMTYMITGFEMIAVGIYALTDRSKSPVWPRWAGWVAIAAALSFVSESWMPFVHAGPFTLDGGWNFWVGFPAWLIWFAIYTYYLIRYIRGRLAEKAELRDDAVLGAELYEHAAVSVDG